MGWSRARPRSIWRTIGDTLVFLSVLFIVVMVLERFNLLAVPEQQVLAGGFEVIDGDSLRQGAAETRLVGIDAPEYRQTCKDALERDYACGKQAAAVLKALVTGVAVECESHEMDRYRRALATCRTGATNINSEMVRRGWAVAYGFHGAAFDYVSEQAEARKAKRGMWQGPFETPSDYRKRQRAVQSDATGLAEPDD